MPSPSPAAPQRGIDVDMNAISDTAQTLAVVALFANGPTTIRGVAHIRHKETDRIGDLARELRKFGATVEESPDGLRNHSPGRARLPGPIEIETYNDHRMAMSFALAGLSPSRHHHPQSRLHGQDLSAIFRGFGPYLRAIRRQYQRLTALKRFEIGRILVVSTNIKRTGR